jgi:hypothetical protein
MVYGRVPGLPSPVNFVGKLVLALGSLILLLDLGEMAIDLLLPEHPPRLPQTTQEVEYEVEYKGISSCIILESQSLIGAAGECQTMERASQTGEFAV